MLEWRLRGRLSAGGSPVARPGPWRGVPSVGSKAECLLPCTCGPHSRSAPRLGINRAARLERPSTWRRAHVRVWLEAYGGPSACGLRVPSGGVGQKHLEKSASTSAPYREPHTAWSLPARIAAVCLEIKERFANRDLFHCERWTFRRLAAGEMVVPDRPSACGMPSSWAPPPWRTRTCALGLQRRGVQRRGVGPSCAAGASELEHGGFRHLHCGCPGGRGRVELCRGELGWAGARRAASHRDTRWLACAEVFCRLWGASTAYWATEYLASILVIGGATSAGHRWDIEAVC